MLTVCFFAILEEIYRTERKERKDEEKAAAKAERDPAVGIRGAAFAGGCRAGTVGDHALDGADDR